jgi:hypothetical protein
VDDVEISGDFEIHLTVSDMDAGALAGFAEEHGLKLLHIVLDRGSQPSQPMLTIVGSGTLDRQRGAAERWAEKLTAAKLRVSRVKIEAAPWNDGVPTTDAEAAEQPPVCTHKFGDRAPRYFEHHIKLLLPDGDVERVVALTDLVSPLGARPSRNARRKRADGREERFLTQRCAKVGLETARGRLEQLESTLLNAGYEILAIEQEYVVHDDNLNLDDGWFTPVRDWRDPREGERRESAVAGKPGFPTTFQPLALSGVRQRAVFDPALKQFGNAFRHGEPEFADEETGVRWRQARGRARDALLTLIADSEWSESLVLRGSVTMRSWIGDAAREPGDIDFVVLPFSRSIRSYESVAMIDGIIAATGRSDVRVEDIWTYERADGRRIVVPFEADGVLPGSVQVDFVFNEALPIPPEPLHLPSIDRIMLAATPGLSLAWKLLWLATDTYPQGKDLYDAVLLAEHTTAPPLAMVADLMRPELKHHADEFGAESVLAWTVDWANFRDEYLQIDGDGSEWLRRLAIALDRAWR